MPRHLVTVTRVYSKTLFVEVEAENDFEAISKVKDALEDGRIDESDFDALEPFEEGDNVVEYAHQLSEVQESHARVVISDEENK